MNDLRTALSKIHNWLVCHPIATAEDMAQSFVEMEQTARDALTAAMPQVDGEAISDAALDAYDAAYIEAFRSGLGGRPSRRAGIAAALPHLFAPLPFQGEPVTAELWRFLPGMPKPSQGDNYTADDMEAFALAALDNAAHLLASLRPAPLPPQGAAVSE